MTMHKQQTQNVKVPARSLKYIGVPNTKRRGK
jgi:hypothetical protein